MKNSIAAVSILLASAAAWVRPAPPQIIRADVLEFLSHVSMIDQPIDDWGHTVRAVQISGLNVQIVNGTGQTNFTNGAGNLIVGYNETGFAFDRMGSHNFIVGDAHTWTQNAYGGIVCGDSNRLDEANCSILGGAGNMAEGWLSVVVGGTGNRALGERSVVAGGYDRLTGGQYDFVAGSLYEDN